MTCLLPRWRPAYRWRELGSGSDVERGNLSPRMRRLVSETTQPAVQGRTQVGETTRARVPTRGTGADRLVGAMKPGNAGRAKEADCSGSFSSQPP